MPVLLKQYKSPRLWVTVLLTLVIFERWTVFNTPLPGIDGSWIIAIHLTHQIGLIHGTEFVFTYGPLGWLITRLPLGVPGWPIALFDLLWLVNIGSVIYLAIGANPTLKRTLFVSVLVMLHHQCASSEVAFSFYFFVLFWLVYHQRTQTGWALAAAVGMAVMTFYLKANVGLVCIGTVLAYGLWPGIGTYRTRLIAAGSLTGLLLISAYYLPVQLYPFLQAHFHLIDSYNDVMYSLQEQRALVVIVFIIGLSAGLLLFAMWRIWQKGTFAVFWRNDGLLLLLVSLQVFVLFKESFVRADIGHTALFFKYGSWPFGLLVLFCSLTWLRRMALVPVTLIALASPFFAPFHWYPDILYRWIPRTVAYCQDVINPKRPELAALASPWPSRWLTQLHSKRVDVIPVDISLLFADQLRYAPRPVIQTYQVTDTYLDSLNAAYYLSDRAPDYVLLTPSSTDERDPFADETRTKLALLRAYEVADTTSGWLLLQKRLLPLSLSIRKKEVIHSQLNEPITVPEDSASVQLWHIEGHYGVGGSLVRWLFQPPRLKLELTYVNGVKKEFRTALPLLNDGLLLSGHPQAIRELNQYWQLAGQVPRSERVKSVRILSEGRVPMAYKPFLRITRLCYQLGNPKLKEKPTAMASVAKP